MSASEGVRTELHRLIEALPAGDLAELAHMAERLSRRHDRRARLEWVSEYVRRLPEAERSEAWTALLWLVGERPAQPTDDERQALLATDSEPIPWDVAKQRLRL